MFTTILTANLPDFLCVRTHFRMQISERTYPKAALYDSPCRSLQCYQRRSSDLPSTVSHKSGQFVQWDLSIDRDGKHRSAEGRLTADKRQGICLSLARHHPRNFFLPSSALAWKIQIAASLSKETMKLSVGLRSGSCRVAPRVCRGIHEEFSKERKPIDTTLIGLCA